LLRACLSAADLSHALFHRKRQLYFHRHVRRRTKATCSTCACTLTCALPWPCGVHQHEHQHRLMNSVACCIDDSFEPWSIRAVVSTIPRLSSCMRSIGNVIAALSNPRCRRSDLHNDRSPAALTHSTTHPTMPLSFDVARWWLVMCVGWSRAHDRSLVGSKVNHPLAWHTPAEPILPT
jgi:hypothetical protein